MVGSKLTHNAFVQANLEILFSEVQIRVQCFVWPDLCPNCSQRLSADKLR